MVVEGLFGRSGGIWGLEADEGEGVAGFSFLFDSDLLDVTELFEKILKLLLSPFSWEVLDVKIASLL